MGEVSSAFQMKMRQLEAKPECALQDVPSFLIMPVQRVPRYEMLLKSVFKNTDKQHIDYEGLRKAVYEIETVAEFLNDKKRESENVESNDNNLDVFKKGWLIKKGGNTRSNWTRRWFILRHGRISYYSDEDVKKKKKKGNESYSRKSKMMFYFRKKPSEGRLI